MQKKHLISPAPIYDKKNRRHIPQYNNDHIQETYCQHHTQWAKTKSISLKIRNKLRVSAFTTLIQHNSGSPSHSN